jgi:solute:Na+ symporter, SSS family
MGYLDYIICAIYLVGILAISVKVTNKKNSITHFLVADRAISPMLGVASLIGTELGLITIMYNAQTGFKSGLAALHIAIIAGIVTFIIGKTGWVVVPLRKLKVLTIPEFYEKRYDKQTRILGAIILVTAGILNMGLFLKVAALFVATIFNIPAAWIALVMAILIACVLLYTLLGGMTSVITTDFIQFITLTIGLVLFLAFLLHTIPWNTMIQTWVQHNSIQSLNPAHTDSGFGVSYILWMIITAGLVSTAIWPTALSRALVMKSSDAVKKQYIWASIPMMGRFVLPILIGTFCFAYITLNSIPIHTPLTALPIVASHLLPVGALGILVAGLLAAMMSTLDGYLLCWASVIVRDIIMPLSKRGWGDKQQILWVRILIVASALFMFYWGLFYKGSDTIWDYLSITGAIYFTGAIPVIIGGLYWKPATSRAAKWSMSSGLLALLGLEPVRNLCAMPFTLPQIGLITIIVSTTLFVGISLMQKQNKMEPCP